MEALYVCHTRAPLDGWQATHQVARKNIEEYMHGAGPALDARHTAIRELRVKFDSKCPGPDDPALIRNYIDSIEASLRQEAEDAS